MVSVVVLVSLLPDGGSLVGVVWARFGGVDCVSVRMVIGSGLRGLGFDFFFYFAPSVDSVSRRV